MNSGDSGSLNNLMYDKCATEARLHVSTTPLEYQTELAKYVNCKKCQGRKDAPWTDVVRIEDELRGLTRPGSLCDQFKYSPACERSDRCISTFDPSIPTICPPELHPIVENNIPKVVDPGYDLTPKIVAELCKKK